ncbi:trypsin-like peptidase domain-containing protein [Engelhardtia mirabilis]|uniref:Protease 1 n=1 Tax=Engelhardtia mirabilis TaxID=2528011 RepID=A0A518BI68_9BACT|nr:Protease 1 precursor [Planctomycetes bacterium Pla133]QDV01005.1 Protease 1 precursor [Planctomycetes bacterium Pla86]
MRSQSWILVSALLAAPAAAQIESEGSPMAVLQDLRTDGVPIEFVQPPDVGAYLADDEVRPPLPLRYGALMPVSINPADNGVWDELADGTMVWRFKVYSPGAKSIGLEFDDFWLPDGAEIYLYDDTLETVFGAFTSINNQPHEQIAFAPFPGDSVIFEYVQPTGVEDGARLSLGTVIYDYRNVFNLEAELDAQAAQAGGSGAGGSCTVNVNCSEGDAWEQQKRATVRTLSNGGLCSGALVNNTAGDGTPYVYTAWHCNQGSNTVFRFNYQTANCNGGSAPTNQNVSGATNLVNHQSSDGRLLRINNSIPNNYLPFYAGWRNTSTNPTFAMSMNHPAGGPKKICVDNNGATKTTANFQGIGNVSVWRCFWNVGESQGGSSGGPLFDNNGRAIGALSGGPGGTCVATTYFGRLNVFWSNANVAQYLDPLGTGATAIAGLDPFGGGPGSFPTVDSISPTSIQTVSPNSPVVATLTGTGFDGATAVEVDGTPLPASDYAIVNDTTITVTLYPPYKVGTYVINVVEGLLDDSINLGSSFALVPTIDLVNSSPAFLTSTSPAEIYMGGFPLETVYLTGSLSNVPSAFPGVVNLGIGNNGLQLVIIGIFTVDPLLGYAKTEVNLPLPAGTTVYFQAANLSAIFPTFPLTASNIETGVVLF